MSHDAVADDAGHKVSGSSSSLTLSGDTTINYEENGEGSVATYRLSGSDGAITWSLSGDDSDDFSLAGESATRRELSFTSPPNYEDPTDADADNRYDVTIRASDGTNTSTLQVTVFVTNVLHDADELPVITGTARAGETLTVDTSPIPDTDQDTTFGYLWIRTDGDTDTNIDGATSSSYTLTNNDEGKTIKVLVGFRTTGGELVRLTSAPTAAVVSNSDQQPINTPATGAPTISGTAQVGQTLTADTSGIADADSLTGATFSYQWLSSGNTEIQEATGATYNLVAADQGRIIKVRVTFTDDGGHYESLTSAATAAVAAAAQDNSEDEPSLRSYITVVVTADYSDPDNAVTSFTITFNDSHDCSSSYNAYVGSYDAYLGSGDAGDPIHLGSATLESERIASSVTNLPGEPGGLYVYLYCGSIDSGRDVSYVWIPQAFISLAGTYSSEPPLTALTVSAGTLTPAFHSHTLDYTVPDVANVDRRITLTTTAKDGYNVVFIQSQNPVNYGKGCSLFGYRCRVQYLDPLTGNHPDPLTDADADMPGFQVDLDEGENVFTIHVHAQRGTAGDLMYTLRITRAALDSKEQPENAPATGSPTISGTAQVGETLAADTSGIADADGLTGAAFSYQWLSSRDTEIQGATDATYTLVPTDEGKTIKVRVTFTDDAGNEESLTSAPTDVITARPTGICDRTPQVRDAILAMLHDVSDCALVTDAHLAGITTGLWISNNDPNRRGEALSLKSGDFAGLVNMGSLGITDYTMGTLPEDIFDGLGSLETLTLKRTQLNELPEDVFDGLDNLKSLDLESNQISTLPDDVFDDLGNLASLGLSYNQLGALPADFFDALGKVHLDLQENQLSALPEGVFNGLGSLERLDLSYNEIRAVPEDVFDGLGNLVRLDLQKNQLSGLPEGVFSGLGSLERLTLNYNEIWALPEDLFDDLGSLEWLALDSNGLGSPPEDVFDGLASLKGLSLSHNRISTLREDLFDGLANLEYLWLHVNQISVLPEGVFDGLGSLRGLGLDNNWISTLPDDVFDDLGNLTSLDLGTNRLGALPEDFFDELGNLTFLALGNNQIRTLPEDVFDGLGNLEYLSLQYNQISVLPEDVFHGLGNLKRLFLAENQLSVLPEDVFDGLGNLDILLLQNNPGSPFTFTAELEQQGENSVVIRVAQGAPFEMTIGISALGGTLSSSTTKIKAGHTTSKAVSVTPRGDGAVTVSVQSAEFPRAADHSGIQTGLGQPLVMGDAESVNTPATGAPAISGTAQVGETLTASTSGIADADGLTNATFSYQWLSSRDTDIQGATDATYTLMATDAGKTIKVRVSFTDDANNEETLTSAPTAAVIAATPTSGGICDRTPEVRDAILAKLPNVSDCAEVTESHLSGIAGKLDLDDAGIATLKQGDFGGLSNLASLDLDFNDLAELPADVFDGLSNLESLDLDFNDLAELPADVFDGLSNLESLDLDFNDLTELPADVFDGLSNLESLDLGANDLTELPANVFDGLSNLRYLYLKINELRKLRSDVFDGLSNLMDLNLRDNDLSELPAGVFEGVSNLITLDLQYNPGSPFTLTAELEQQGDGALVLKVDEGAPSDMTVTLSAQGGTLSATTVTIDGGNVSSGPVTVTPTGEGRAQVTVSVESAAFRSGDYYSGIQTGLGEPLVLRDAESVNTPATGAPAINGTAQVGETLTTSTSGIADADGLSGATFSYQWLSSRDTEIPGATDSTYTLLDADEGKIIKVRVTFTDDAGNEESLTSSATAAVAASAQTDSEHEPSLRSYITVVVTEDASDPDNVETRFTITWSDVDDCSTGYNAYLSNGMDVARGGDTTHLGSAATDGSQITRSLSNVEGEGIIFRVGLYCGTEDSGRLVSNVSIPHDDGPSSEESNRRLVPSTYSSEPPLTGLTVSPGTLTPTFHSHTLNTVLYTVPDVVRADDRLTLVATAKPDYSVVFVKDVLASSIVCSPWSFSCTGWSYKDEDGNRVYPLTDADANSPGFQVDLAVGEKLTIHVHREYRGTPLEDGSYRLTVTRASNSPATGTPIISGTAQVGETLTVDTSGIDDSDGLSGVTYRYQWISNDGTADSDIQSATDSTYTLVATDEGKTIKVRVTFTDDGGYEESLISAPTAAVAARPNTPGTGAPTISGTAQVGETLTVDTSGIADADGLSGATFSYQWLSSRDTEIPGATDATYTLLDADAGKTIKVRVSFTDDAGHEETLTSAATAAVPPASGPAVAIGLSPSGSVTEGTDIALTMSFANLESDSDTSDTDYIFRADVVNADGCEGGGMGGDRYMYKVDEDPEVRAGTISASCAPGDYTVEVSISSPGNVELASATADFTVAAPAEQQQAQEPRPSTDATLSSLALSDVTLAFASSTTEYAASVANDVDETTVTPTTNDDEATYEIKLGGVADADGAIPLAVGSNVITIEVTAEDGETTKTYTVTITRAAPPSTDATLNGLALSGIDFGTFDPDTTGYTASVANDVDETTVTPATNDAGASYVIKLGGVADDDGVIPLTVGSNVIAVEVTAEDGETTKTYTATVTRAAPPSTDATLSGLALSGIDFGAFDSATTEYTASVANEVAETTVTPTANDDGATYAIKLDDAADEDGTVELSVGANVVSVVVTAEDGQSIKTYTVTVTRAEAPAPEPTVVIALSSDSAEEGTEITVTMSFANLTPDNDANLVFRADVVGADGCEGQGIGVARNISKVDEDPEIRTGTISRGCTAGDYTLEVSLTDDDVQLASALADFSVVEPDPTDEPAPTSPPGVPDTPTGEVTGKGQVRLDWNDVEGATYYQVRFYGNEDWVELPTDEIEIVIDGSGARVSNLPYYGFYYFSVRAGNAAGVSEWSDFLTLPNPEQ